MKQGFKIGVILLIISLMTYGLFEAMAALSTPTITEVKSGDECLWVNWEPIADANQYRIWYKQVSPAINPDEYDPNDPNAPAFDPNQDIAGVAGTILTVKTACTIYPVVNGQQYMVAVSALDSNGDESLLSDLSFCTIETLAIISALSKPIISDVKSGNESLWLNWSDVAGADQYKIWYKQVSPAIDYDEYDPNDPDAPAFDPNQDIAGTTDNSAYTVTSLLNGQQYMVAVSAIDPNDTESERSDPEFCIVKEITFLFTPVLVEVRSGSESLWINWDSVVGAEQYRVWFKAVTSSVIPEGYDVNDPNAPAFDAQDKDNTILTDKTSCTLGSLASGQQYMVAISAIDEDGNETACSAPLFKSTEVGQGLASLAGEDGNCFISVCKAHHRITLVKP